MPRSTVTVAVAVARYLGERGNRGDFAAETLRTVASTLRLFAVVVGPELPVSRLSRTQVHRWWADMKCSRSTARNRLSTVRTFLRWCIDNDLLRRDPSRDIRPPKEPRRMPRTISAEAAGRLVASLPDARAKVIVLWMLHLGLRCGEVARLQIGDVDFDQRLLLVRGKGGHERILPIPDEAWSALLTYLAEEPATAGPLVRNQRTPHQAITAQHVSRLVHDWMAAAGLKATALDGISAHGLRRTCASDILDNGGHIRQVQQVLGHASISTTERYLRRRDAVDLRGVMGGRSYRPLVAGGD